MKKETALIKIEALNQSVSTLKQELRNTVLLLIQNNYIIGHEGITFEIIKYQYTYDMDSEHHYHIVKIEALSSILEVFIEMIEDGDFVIEVNYV